MLLVILDVEDIGGQGDLWDGLLKGTACVPFDPLETGVGKVAQRIQATANGHSAAGGRPEWVIIVGIECGMVVEVLLNVDQRDVVLGEQLANASSIGCLVARDIVAIENSR